jgi:hypothetical protein
LNILEHDIENGTATLQFQHNNVTHKQTYDLGAVVPGLRKTLEQQGQQFTLEKQMEVIQRVTTQVQREIEQGILHNSI